MECQNLYFQNKHKKNKWCVYYLKSTKKTGAAIDNDF